MRNILKIAMLVSLLALAWGAGWLASGIGVGRVAPEATLEERERAFEESMRNVILGRQLHGRLAGTPGRRLQRPLRDRGGHQTGRRPMAVRCPDHLRGRGRDPAGGGPDPLGGGRCR